MVGGEDLIFDLGKSVGKTRQVFHVTKSPPWTNFATRARSSLPAILNFMIRTLWTCLRVAFHLTQLSRSEGGGRVETGGTQNESNY